MLTFKEKTMKKITCVLLVRYHLIMNPLFLGIKYMQSILHDVVHYTTKLYADIHITYIDVYNLILKDMTYSSRTYENVVYK